MVFMQTKNMSLRNFYKFIDELNSKDLNTIAPYIREFYDSYKNFNNELK